jgi:transcriptional regulator with XRE-family HTH domain
VLNVFNYLGELAMDLEEIGQEIRRSRLARGLTQRELAATAHVTRTTLNQLENGALKDLGVRKVKALLDQVGLILYTADASGEPRSPDFLRLASTSASVSFKETLTEKELLRVLLSGRVPSNRRSHVRKLFEESPRPLLEGLIRQMKGRLPPGKFTKNLDTIATILGIENRPTSWWKKNG